jgi:hypothetical protein
MFAYGFARGMRSEYHNNVYSTRILYSFCNGVYYGTCIIHPMLRLMNRVQYHYQGLDPNHVTVHTIKTFTLKYILNPTRSSMV